MLSFGLVDDALASLLDFGNVFWSMNLLHSPSGRTSRRPFDAAGKLDSTIAISSQCPIEASVCRSFGGVEYRQSLQHR